MLPASLRRLARSRANSLCQLLALGFIRVGVVHLVATRALPRDRKRVLSLRRKS